MACVPPDLEDLPNKDPAKADTDVGDLKASAAPDHLLATPPADEQHVMPSRQLAEHVNEQQKTRTAGDTYTIQYAGECYVITAGDTDMIQYADEPPFIP